MNKFEINTWMPQTEHIIMASELAILASLDANLVLATRTLLATHDCQLPNDHTADPCPPYLALAQSILTLAESLHALIASYNVVVQRTIGDA